LTPLLVMCLLVLLLFAISVYSSIKTTESPSWISRLDPESDDYVNQLYCGTVARGITYLTDAKKPVDSEGFEEGLAKIIKVYESDSKRRPILNGVELKWLRSQFVAIWKERGIKATWKNRGNISKVYRVLLFMKKISNKEISFASLLADAKDKKVWVRAEEISHSLSFLDHAKQETSDPACSSLIDKLKESLTSRQMRSTESAPGKGIKSWIKTLQNRHIIKKAIDEAVDKAMESVHEDYTNRSEIRLQLKTAADKAVNSSSAASKTLESVIESAISEVIPPSVTVASLAKGMETRPQLQRNIIAAIIEGINGFPKDVPNREITFISIYLFSHIKTYKQTASPEEKTTLYIAAEMLSKYMKPTYRDSKNEQEAKMNARPLLGIIFTELDINIDKFMRFTNEEIVIIQMDLPTNLFREDNDVFWILQIIGMDFYKTETPHPRVKDLIAILKDYKSSLTYAGPGISLVRESLEKI
jgi:hypothetical protein